MSWARYSHGHTLLQGQIPRESKIISYSHKFYFRFFIILIYQDMVTLAVFRGFLGFLVWDTVSESDTPVSGFQ